MMSLSDLTTGPITVFVFLNLTTVGWTQSCVITGGINLGTTTQNCIVVGPARLTFQPALAEELISKLSPGKVRRAQAPARHHLVVLAKHVFDGHVPIGKCDQQLPNESLHGGKTFH